MALFMETTKIPAEKTAAEIQHLLAQAGASQIVVDYKDRELSGLRWTMEIYGQTIPFCLPARVDPVFQLLLKKLSPHNRNKKSEAVLEQAKRVAWRQLLRWTQAQLALIETGMVKSEEVFMPYMQTFQGQTLFEQLVTTGFKALPAGER